MRHVLFGGCSFTHSGDSWAHCARPLIYEPIFDGPEQLDHFGINACTLDVRGGSLRTTLDRLEGQRKLYNQYYNCDEPEYDPTTFVRKCKVLDVDQYRICFAGEGAASNSLSARAVINYLEKHSDVDTVVYQITGFARREVLTLNQRDLDITIRERTEYDIYRLGEITYIKQPGDITVQMVESEESEDKLRIYSAYYSDYCADINEYYIRALDQLQILSQYCKLNNIKLGYFHGWDNLPTDWLNYCQTKYDRYVKPYLITNENILDYYRKKYPNKTPRDLEYAQDFTKLILGNHPHPLAHRQFWNDIVEPFVR